MELHVASELEAKLIELATTSGRAPDDLIREAITGYLDEIAQVRTMLDSRYDEIVSGKVKPIDGEEFFEALRQREDRLTKPI